MKHCMHVLAMFLLMDSVAAECRADEAPGQDRAVALLKEMGASIQLDRDAKVVTLDLPESAADKDLAIVAQVKTVGYLNLSGSKITDAGLAQLGSLERLHTLRLRRTGVTDAGMTHLKEIRGLASIDVSLTAISDAGLELIAKCPTLQDLDLEGTRVTDHGVALLNGLAELESIDMGGTDLSDAGIAQLHWPKLTNIDVTGTEVSQASLDDLKKRLPKIAILPAKVPSLPEQRQGLRALKQAGAWLSFDANGELVAVIVKGERGNNDLLKRMVAFDKLDRLWLSDAKVDREGLAALAKLPNLNRLYLWYVPLGDDDLAPLRSCKALTYLSLFDAKVRAETAREFEQNARAQGRELRIDLRGGGVLGAGVYDDGGCRMGSSPTWGAAFRAGLQPGDVIVGFNGQKVADCETLLRLSAASKPGDRATYDIRRDAQEFQVNVTLGKQVMGEE